MSDITKEEIAIMIDVQSKTVVNLEKIATALKDIVDEQKAITESQTKLKDELVKGIIVEKLQNISEHVLFNRNLYTMTGVVIIVAVVVLKVFNL